ncbi:MAG: hypothetical protein LBQ50_12955, partial [Planctomycetaceae bacterium]|nr:hypothetical protein [Planctomycetaceae bacterium]
QQGNQSGQQGNQSGQQGNQSGQQGNQSGQQSNQSEQQGNQSGQNQMPSSVGDENGTSGVTGQPSSGGSGRSTSNIETLPEDPNLEYTKKMTNLVLEYLEDQLKEKPSQELLDNLGWTEKELREFHHKWLKMSEQSRRSENKTTNDDTKWREAFKSLGLRPGQDRQQLQKSRTGVQDESKATESQRFAPPSAIKERFKRYTEGIGK